MSEKKNYYLSQYALSDGIKAVEVNHERCSSDEWLTPDGYWQSYRLGKQIHETQEGANAAAEAMRLKKIVSLKKSIAKLEKLSFSA